MIGCFSTYFFFNIFNVLFQNGVNPNFQLDDKLAPLHLSSKNGHIQCTFYLLQYNANVNMLSKVSVHFDQFEKSHTTLGLVGFHLITTKTSLTFIELLCLLYLPKTMKDSKNFTRVCLKRINHHCFPK
jgi:hypothetical protein